MEWEKPLRNYMMVLFTRDRVLVDVLAAYFGNMQGVTIVDLLGMGESLAGKFIDAFNIDIAFLEEASVDCAPVCKIIEKACADCHGANTHFILRYDCQNAVKIKDFGDSLLEKRLPVTPFRLDEEEDYEILAQTIHGILNGRQEQERIRMTLLERELTGLPDGENPG